MSKIKLVNLKESFLSTSNTTSERPDVVEIIGPKNKPNFKILDVTLIPDETYNPTIQSLLIDLDENDELKESEDKRLDINVLSETVNQKTGYSNSLFEFESTNHTITLSLVLQESHKKGLYTVQAYTTKGEKVFESNTYKPKETIGKYLNSLAEEYLIDKTLNEADSIKEDAIDNARADTAMGGAAYDDYMTNFGQDDSDEDESYTPEEFRTAQILSDKLLNNDLNIDYSNWNSLDNEQRVNLVKPKLEKFYQDNKNILSNKNIVDLVIYNLEDNNFNTEASTLFNIINKSNRRED